ncbi:hypothetical protein [Amycolatopsis sp. La24]|uniref:hypothetical protein n=1 Tax=Amycolatopsis sp. La24 TaxID=3028304 RepID=UPI0023B06C89|nr:hypothetical protein [Amycolatopsis sp. La24]
MGTSSDEQSRREAFEIAVWAEGRPDVLGCDSRDLNQEAGVGNTCGGDNTGLPSLGPLAPFGSWQSVAATIMRKTADSARFDQSSTIFDLFRWIVFGNQFTTMPFLTGITGDSRSVSISSLSLSPVISAVTQLVGGLVTLDTLTGIVNSIKKIGQLAVENKGLQEKNSNVHQGVLTVVNGNLRLGRLQTTVQMEYKTGKGYQQLNQHLTVSRLFGNLDYGLCIRNAEILLAWDRQEVDEWVKGASSSPYPPNDSPAWSN